MRCCWIITAGAWPRSRQMLGIWFICQTVMHSTSWRWCRCVTTSTSCNFPIKRHQILWSAAPRLRIFFLHVFFHRVAQAFNILFIEYNKFNFYIFYCDIFYFDFFLILSFKKIYLSFHYNHFVIISSRKEWIYNEFTWSSLEL